MTLIAPLNLEYLFVNVFSGTTIIFIGVALLIIAGLSGRFKMPASVMGMMFVLFGILTMQLAPWLYVLVIVLTGIIVGYTFSRIVKS